MAVAIFSPLFPFGRTISFRRDEDRVCANHDKRSRRSVTYNSVLRPEESFILSCSQNCILLDGAYYVQNIIGVNAKVILVDF